MKKNPIYVLSAELVDSERENIMKNARNDPNLINVIDNYIKKELVDVEIFERHHNVIITENGYYLSVYEDEIKEVVEE